MAIQKNIAIIQAAANEIDAALAKDPASGMLKSLLVGAYKQELQLYSMVVTSNDGLKGEPEMSIRNTVLAATILAVAATPIAPRRSRRT